MCCNALVSFNNVVSLATYLVVTSCVFFFFSTQFINVFRPNAVCARKIETQKKFVQRKRKKFLDLLGTIKGWDTVHVFSQPLCLDLGCWDADTVFFSILFVRVLEFL